MSSKEWREKNPEKARSYSQNWRKKNPEKAAAASKRYKVWHMANRAGIPKELTEAALEAKKGPCWICGAGPDAQKNAHSADHDHTSGEFRGILCGRCNVALGQLWDTPELCEAAADYLRDPPGLKGLTDSERASFLSRRTEF